MPTYAYRCTVCGNELDVQQSFSDPSLTDCPSCGGALRKLFSSVGVVFKGSGFYRNDARAGSGKASGTAASSGSGGGDGSATPAAGGGPSSGSNGSSGGGTGGSSSPTSTSTASTPSSTPKAAAT